MIETSFSMLDPWWVANQFRGGNPIPFLMWTLFIALVFFAAGKRWGDYMTEKQIHKRLGKIREFNRTVTLSDLINKAADLADSASSEAMKERAVRISELEDKVIEQSHTIVERDAVIDKLRNDLASTAFDDNHRLKDQNEQLRAECKELKGKLMRIESEKTRDSMQSNGNERQAITRLSKLTAYEAKAVKKIYETGSIDPSEIDMNALRPLIDKRVAIVCADDSLFGKNKTIRLSDQITRDINNYGDQFKEMFGLDEG